jgi:hypothetical protein
MLSYKSISRLRRSFTNIPWLLYRLCSMNLGYGRFAKRLNLLHRGFNSGQPSSYPRGMIRCRSLHIFEPKIRHRRIAGNMLGPEAGL